MTVYGDVTVIVPHHAQAGRGAYLGRCLESIDEQTLRPHAVIVSEDWAGYGAWWAKDQALAQVLTPYVAFVDSDDYLLPQHLDTLYVECLRQGLESGLEKSYAYSYFMGVDQFGGLIPDDPLELFGKEFNPLSPTQTTSTVMVSTAMAREVGFTEPIVGRCVPWTTHAWGEDYSFTRDCVKFGALPVHIPERTWCWRFWPGNTSGLPEPTDRSVGVAE